MSQTRDFKESTRKQIVKEIKQMKSLKLWLNLVKDLGLDYHLSFLNPLSNPFTFVEKIRTLEARVHALLDGYILRVNSAFTEARDIDKETALKGEYLLQSGKALLDKLMVLTELATPERLSEVLTHPAFIHEHTIDGEDRISVGVVINSKIPAISDNDLIAAVKLMSDSEFSEMLSHASDAICKMSFGDAFLIALFQHKEILKDQIVEILTGEEYSGYRSVIIDQIFDNADGYDTVESIAAELGLTIDETKYFLKNGNLLNYRSDLTFKGRDDIALLREAKLNGMHEKIIQRNFERMIKDDDMFRAFALKAGVDETVLKAVLDGKYDGYMKRVYQATTARTLEKICNEQEVVIYPQKIEKWMGVIQKGIGAVDGGEMNKSLKKIQGLLNDNKSADKDILEFLNKYCGSDGVRFDGNDVKAFAMLAKGWGKVGTGSKYLGDLQKATDYITRWTADYEGELRMVDDLLELNGDNPEFKQALLDLKREYESRSQRIYNDAIDAIVEEGIDAAFRTYKPLKLAETAISLAGEITGSKGYANAAQQTISLSLVSSEAVEQYRTALTAVKNGNTSPEMLSSLRTSFAFAKQSMHDYYLAQAEYYKGFILDTGSSPRMVEYLEHEAFRIDNYEIGESFDPMSYQEFLTTFGS